MGELTSLRIVDYTDRELLHILNDVANEEGWASSEDLAKAIGIKPRGDDPRGPRRCVAMRFAWMARYGWVRRDPSNTMWCLTKDGEDLMSGQLRPALQQSLKEMRAADRVLLMREMTNAYRNAPKSAAAMYRREWVHGTAR